MEQIKLITEHTIDGLERKINKFMATLDEHTDIIDVTIDSGYTDEPFVVLRDHLLAVIRFATYKIDEKQEIPPYELVDLPKCYSYPVLDVETQGLVDGLHCEGLP